MDIWLFSCHLFVEITGTMMIELLQSIIVQPALPWKWHLRLATTKGHSCNTIVSRVLLEGVADRDWGIAFSVVNGRINKQKFLSDLYF